jgi:hypothetical protein
LRYPREVGELTHIAFTVAAQVLENRPTGRVGKRSENGALSDIHFKTITEWLLISQAAAAD